MNSNRFFKNMKYLKQHFLKVHAEKNFYCEMCKKGYSTEAAKKKHVRMCGVKFMCSCNYSYDSYEALITHAKRHQHTFDERYKSYGKDTSAQPSVENGINSSMNLTQDLQSTSTAIAVPVHLLAAVALSELSGKCLGTAVDKGIQTETKNLENKRQRKAPSVCRNSTRRRTSTQTQTGNVARNKHPKISTETQTMGDYILKKAMRAADIPILPKESCDVKKEIKTKKRRKSMETQTTNHLNTSMCDNNNDNMINYVDKYSPVMDPSMNFASLNQFPSLPYTSLCSNGSPYRLDMELPDLWMNEKNSSGTQTSPVALNTLMEHEEMLSHSVTQTDLNLALFDTDACEPSTSNISSQTMNSLQSYFEDTSDSSFGSSVIPSVPFGPVLASTTCGTSMDPLVTLSDEPGYSSEQIDRILTRNTKLIFDENKSCSIETQTELDINNTFYQGTDDDTSFTLCSNIETQTTEDLSSLDHLLYTNMCTQTCEDFLFSDLGFVDIQTQTAGDDSLLVSTETQTALSGCSENEGGNSSKPWFLSSVKPTMSGTSHMETQTNTNEFREFIAALVKQEPDDKLL